MTNPIGYWCPVCECIADGKLCKADAGGVNDLIRSLKGTP